MEGVLEHLLMDDALRGPVGDLSQGTRGGDGYPWGRGNRVNVHNRKVELDTDEEAFLVDTQMVDVNVDDAVVFCYCRRLYLLD